MVRRLIRKNRKFIAPAERSSPVQARILRHLLIGPGADHSRIRETFAPAGE
jgi:hypothetical protein